VNSINSSGISDLDTFKLINNKHNDENIKYVETILSLEKHDLFEIVCTCCDKKRISSDIIPKLVQKKNIDMFQMLFKRPKNVDNQVIVQFIILLTGSIGFNSSCFIHDKLINKEKDKLLVNSIKSKIFKNLEGALNHLEFGRYLNEQTLLFLSKNKSLPLQLNSQTSNQNLTYIYKELVKMLKDQTMNSISRLNFVRSSITKLVSQIIIPAITSSNISQISQGNNCESTIQNLNYESLVNKSIFSILNTQNNQHLDQNFNLENLICEGFLKAKTSRNIVDLFIYVIGLGRLALSFSKPRPNEYMFVCVKHLLEIINLSIPYSIKSKN
jgi:hypothetical protein